MLELGITTLDGLRGLFAEQEFDMMEVFIETSDLIEATWIIEENGFLIVREHTSRPHGLSLLRVSNTTVPGWEVRATISALAEERQAQLRLSDMIARREEMNDE